MHLVFASDKFEIQNHLILTKLHNILPQRALILLEYLLYWEYPQNFLYVDEVHFIF